MVPYILFKTHISQIPCWNDRRSSHDVEIPPVTGDVDLTTASEFGGDLGGDDQDEDQALSQEPDYGSNVNLNQAQIQEFDDSDMDVGLKVSFATDIFISTSFIHAYYS